MKSLRERSPLVIPGSFASISANMLEKLGITATTIMTRTATATIPSMIGYIIAFLSAALALPSFSKCSAILSRAISILPDCSPASIMLTRSDGKQSSFFIELARVSPFCTPSLTLYMDCLSVLFSVWSPSISSAVITPTPAFSKLLNCRQKHSGP